MFKKWIFISKTKMCLFFILNYNEYWELQNFNFILFVIFHSTLHYFILNFLYWNIWPEVLIIFLFWTFYIINFMEYFHCSCLMTSGLLYHSLSISSFIQMRINCIQVHFLIIVNYFLRNFLIHFIVIINLLIIQFFIYFFNLLFLSFHIYLTRLVKLLLLL